jgi:hypothetical protein
VELLERIIGQDRGANLVGHAQQKGVASADGPGGRRYHIAFQFGLLEARSLFDRDTVAEGGVDYDCDHVIGIFDEELAHRHIELLEGR